MPMGKRSVLTLSKKDEKLLLKFIRSGKTNARTHLRAEVLLMLHNGLCAAEITKMFGYAHTSTARVMKRYKEGGLDNALFDRARPGRPLKITAEERAKITALACTKAPSGRGRWTLNLLQEKSVELKYVESISRSQIARILKKTNSNPI